MAHFIRSADNRRVSGGQVFIPVNGKTKVGLWGWEQTPGKPLDVKLACTDAVCFSGNLFDKPCGPVRTFELHGKRMGRTKVAAVAANGAVWDWFEAVVAQVDAKVVTIRDMLAAKVESGELSFINENARSVFLAINAGTHKLNGKPVVHSPELETALYALLKQGKVQIMRAFAGPGQSLHGVETGDRWVARAMDITNYGGMRIHWQESPKTQIDAVSAVIRNLPSEVSVGIGFPRPVGHLGFDASRDVFFDVKDAATAKLCNDGDVKAVRPLNALRSESRPAVLAAASGKRIVYSFPDAADHMHLQFPGG